MGANMRCEKNSLALLSGMRTKAFSKNRADEAFALPSFSDAMSMLPVDSSYRAGQKQRLEDHANNVEKLKQTMLQHESMFKEQLYELHRLYQVQKSLMEESKRKSSTSHPHSDSPSSNSSLLYNPESGRTKEERRFWDINNTTKLVPSKQLPFFSGQIDVNMPLEERRFVDQGTDLSSELADGHRPIFDLERPAEEHVETEIDVKPFFRSSYFQVAGNPQLAHLSLQDSQCSFLATKNANGAMHMEKRSSLCREFPSSSKWRSFEDCFTIEHSRQREVPFFSVGTSTSTNCLGRDVNPSSSQNKPVTSLFGVNLNQEINRHVESPVVHNNLDHVRGQLKPNSVCERSTGQPSNLPHWLLQGLQTTSATKTLPINLAHQSQYQSSPFFLKKQAEQTAYFEGRVCSSYAQEELSHSWVKSGGCFSFGETFPSTPQCKPSPGSFLDTLTGHAHGCHKSAQASSANVSVPLVSPPTMERHLGMSSPKINNISSGSETDVAPAFLFSELSSKSKNSGCPGAPWYQRRAHSPSTPIVSKGGAQNQRLSAFSVNSLTSWVNVPAREQVSEGIFTKNTREMGEGTSEGISSFPWSVTRPEAFSRRLVFGFMPTADLDLTLGIDLNESGASERGKSMEGRFNENIPHRQETICQRSDSIKNDFDLNEQLGQVIDAENHATPAGSKHATEVCTRLVQGMSTGVRAAYFEEWQTSHTNSTLKVIPEGTSATTETSRQPTAASGDDPDDKQLHAARVNGGPFVERRSSDGSGLTSSESRSTPIHALTKARDDSTVSGEACQSMAMRQFSREILFDDALMVVEKQQGFLSGMSDVSRSETAEEKLLIEKHMSNDDYASAGNNQTTKHKAEAFKAADVLVLLSLDSVSEVVEDRETHGDQDRTLKWLADIIPQDEDPDMDGGKVCLTGGESLRGISERHPLCIGIQEKVLDSFELSVLNLKPIDPVSETICPQPIQRCNVVEEFLAPPNLRRRSLRRGRLGKDFQKDTLPSIASLSRQEITEDLQILEGLVKSATEAMTRCSLSSKEDVPWLLPALSSVKAPGKAKGFRSCKAGRQNGLLRVCSWGESTRRRRMRRQRRVCLPPGI